MADQPATSRTHRRRWRWRWFSRTAAGAIITVGMVVGTVRPSFAAPYDGDATQHRAPGRAPAGADQRDLAAPTGPDGGATPVAVGEISFPDQLPAIGAPLTPAPPEDPLIVAAAATERLGEQLKAVDDELAAARATTAAVRETWQQTADDLAAVQAKAAAITADAYQGATAMGPFDSFTSDLHDLGLIAPALQPHLGPVARPPERDSVFFELADALAVERAAADALAAATAAEQEITDRRAVILEQFNRHNAALTTLKQRAASVTEVIAARDAFEESLSAGMGLGSSINGLRAAPAAVNAVNFALSQLGKPYVWAAEGPNSYDCSGLTMASYLSVGRQLPRVSRFQYHAGTPVLVSQLLPGDLLFFATDKRDWRSIHHVAIYLGSGRMVHAPNVGDVVKVSPVWWTRYFGATRVIPAVPAPPSPSPAPPPSTTPSPAPSPSPSPSPSPTPDPTPTPTPTPTPDPTPTPTPTPTPDPTPTPTPEATPSTTPSDDPDPTDEPSSSPTDGTGATDPDPTLTDVGTSPDPGLSPAATEPGSTGPVRQQRAVPRRRRWLGLGRSRG